MKLTVFDDFNIKIGREMAEGVIEKYDLGDRNARSILLGGLCY